MLTCGAQWNSFVIYPWILAFWGFPLSFWDFTFSLQKEFCCMHSGWVAMYTSLRQYMCSCSDHTTGLFAYILYNFNSTAQIHQIRVFIPWCMQRNALYLQAKHLHSGERGSVSWLTISFFFFNQSNYLVVFSGNPLLICSSFHNFVRQTENLSWKSPNDLVCNNATKPLNTVLILL